MNLEDLRSLPPALTAREVSDILSIGLNQVYALARSDDLPVLRLGVTLRFPTSRILEMLGLVDDVGPPGHDEGPSGETGPSSIQSRRTTTHPTSGAQMPGPREVNGK